ncbi:aldehyde dehydrogenase [Nocardia amikacinitolerans]|uniref:aldehyde dehydrogenase n=1 Tax=Nocardia amikacinitolerans TaxID=756689 RepID=UPI0020A40FB8|nr:aldehyde dehydrogenase [Nocardia amikacinitolerans]
MATDLDRRHSRSPMEHQIDSTVAPPPDVAEFDQLYIGGRMTAPAGADTIEVVSPHTEKLIGRVPHASREDVDRAVATARAAFDEGPWPRMTVDERLGVCQRFRDAFAARIEQFARLITAQNGAPYNVSMAFHTRAAVLLWDAQIAIARDFPFEERRRGGRNPLLVRQEPVGVVAAIIPWNSPQFLAAGKLAPALLSGCSVVLKASPETPLDAYLLAEVADEAGLPPGVLSILPADREVSEYLVGHPGVDKVSFTGSVAAGKRVMEVASRNLTRVTLELGGKSAAIVLPDADLDAAVADLMIASYGNNGQACIARSRVLAPRSHYDQIAERLTAAVGSLMVGDPNERSTQIGPLVTQRQQRRNLDYIRIGRDEGAKVLAGGGIPAGQPTGWYVEPTLLGNVDNSMRVAREEIFGPVICLLSYEDEADAVRIANDSEFGLSGSVYTGDIEHGIEIARRVRTGTFAVNGFSLDVNGPFGGFKNSGIGREYGPEGFAAYLEPQTVYLPVGYDVSAR